MLVYKFDWKKSFKKWIELLAGTVLANNLLLAKTVSANKKLKFQQIPPPHQSTPYCGPKSARVLTGG